MTRLYAVVLAGGGGTRLWPLSRRSRPKQVLSLAGETSLFGDAIARLRGWLEPEQILVAATDALTGLLQEAAPGLSSASFLIEPEPRGTAPVLGLAAAHLQRVDPDGVMLVLTSDHAIGRPDRLRTLLEAAAELASAGHLVTLGIPPEGADTGYGYIRRGESLGEIRGERAYAVAEFKEKPDPATAEEYFRSGEYYWNSGMFVWRPVRLLEEVERWMPDLHRTLRQAAVRPGESVDPAFAAAWSALEPETIDYGIMERASQVAVLDAADLEWSDVGNWDRVFAMMAKDASENAVAGSQIMASESTGNLVVGEGAERLVVLQGVEGLVVVDAGDVLLICRRDQAGRVRQIVSRLEREGLGRYLT